MPDRLRVLLTPSRLDVTPGLPASFDVEIRNQSDIVEGYRVSLVGLDPEWVGADPEELRLFPEQIGAVTVTVTLPPGYPAGEHNIGVKVQPVAGSTSAWLDTVVLNVPARTDATITVSPSSLTRGRTGDFSVAVNNLGNAPRTVDFSATDAEAALSIEFDPPSVAIGPGQREITRMVAKGKRPLVGSPAARIIHVAAHGPGEPLETQATFVQKPVISQALLTILSVLLAIALWAFVLIYGISRILPGDETTTTAAGAMIEGTVTASDESEGLAGVVVEAFSPDNLEMPVVEPAITSTGGAYTMEGIEDGTYLIRFSAPGRRDVWYQASGAPARAVPVTVTATTHLTSINAIFGTVGAVCGAVTVSGSTPGTSVLESDGRCPRSGDAGGKRATISGRALVGGSPRQGATVKIETGLESATVLTDAAGRYRFINLDEGAYTITVAGDDLQSVRLLRLVSAGEDVEIGTLGLNEAADELAPCIAVPPPSPSGALAGVAVALVVPESEVTEDVLSPTFPPIVTDGNGAFSFPEVPTPGTYQLSLSKIGYADLELPVSLDAEPKQLMVAADTTQLIPGPGSISGRVTGATGACPPVITVTDGRSSIKVFANDDGTYQIDGLAEPGAYKLTVSQDGFPSLSRTVMLEEGVPAEDQDIAMAGDAGVIKGTIWDNTSAALGGVMVTASDGTTEVAFVTDDEGGVFNIVGLPTPGTYSVTFELEGYATIVKVVELEVGGTADFEVVMRPVSAGSLSAILGKVTDAAGAPLGGVSVTANDGEAALSVTSADADGAYEISDPPAGAYAVTFELEGYVSQTVLVKLDAGQRLKLATVALVGPISADALALGVEGIGPLKIGSDGAAVVDALVSLYGPVATDSGVVVSAGEHGTCAGSAVRVVRIRSLRIINTVADGAETFAAYRLDRAFHTGKANATLDLGTISGLKVGQTVLELKSRYVGLNVVFPDAATYQVKRPAGDKLLIYGPVTSTDDAGIVRGIYSPDACPS